MKPPRKLSDTFLTSLKCSGFLHPILHAVQSDATLDLQIRDHYVNIYYRGGNLIRLSESPGGKYNAFFDRKYIHDPQTTHLPDSIGSQDLSTPTDVTAWVDAIPWIKHEMDLWFHRHPKDEREFQQLMVRENNYAATAKSTDYFICDIEYDVDAIGRFDLIAAEWPSSGSERKDNKNIGLAFIEMKYTEKALSNTSGICSHLEDMACFYRKNTDNFAALKEEMQTVFNQKLQLGLIDNQKKIESFNDKTPDFILALANHDPDSIILRRELEEIQKLATKLPFQLKFAASNFMGYGLYKQNIFTLDEFLSRFEQQICARPGNAISAVSTA